MEDFRDPAPQAGMNIVDKYVYNQSVTKQAATEGGYHTACTLYT